MNIVQRVYKIHSTLYLKSEEKTPDTAPNTEPQTLLSNIFPSMQFKTPNSTLQESDAALPCSVLQLNRSQLINETNSWKLLTYSTHHLILSDTR